MRAAVAAGAVEPLLNFIEVEPGDVLEVGPGTPHAVGEGLLLLEPQRLLPGHRGVTWRYWDWNRRFEGVVRDLHLEHALSVTHWGAAPPVPARFGAPSVAGPALSLRLVQGPVLVDRLTGSGPVNVRAGSLTVLEGSLSLGGVSAVAGETLAVRRPGTANLERAHAVSCSV
jgi:mannose-6-phosphate isomerase